MILRDRAGTPDRRRFTEGAGVSPAVLPKRHRRILAVSGLSILALTLSGSPVGAAPAKSHPARANDLAATAHRTAKAAGVKAFAAKDEDEEGSSDIMEQADQWNEARSSPGVVAPGAYSAAWNQLQSLRSTGGRWVDETALPYNS